MSTIVYHGIQPSSCSYESQHEQMSLTLKLISSSKLNLSQCFDHEPPAATQKSSFSSSNSSMFESWGCIQSLVPDAAAAAKSDVYVHPLVKKSSSLLDRKSLEMCTETLGSETGSETAGSSNNITVGHLHQSSSISLFHHDNPILVDDVSNHEIINNADHSTNIGGPSGTLISSSSSSSYSSSSSSSSSGRRNNRKSVVKNNQKREFPPPLTTLSGSKSIHVKRHSVEGGNRLVIETVEAPPSHSFMQAERTNGRLKLSLTTTHHHHLNYYSHHNEPADEDNYGDSGCNEFEEGHHIYEHQSDDDEDEDVVVMDDHDDDEKICDEDRQQNDDRIDVNVDHQEANYNSNYHCDVAIKNGGIIKDENFQSRMRRCNEGPNGGGERGYKTMNTTTNWEPFWVATS